MPGNEPWTPPAPIAASGRVAAWTVAACLAASGLATIALSWNELTCTTVVDPGGDRVAPASVCEVLTGIGGLALILGAAAIAGALIIVLRIKRRPVTETGADGWRWGMGIVFTIGLAVLVTRFPNQTCPSGVHLSAPFGLCIDTVSGDRFDATSWVWLKLLAAGLAPVVGFGIVARRGATAIAVPLALIAWAAGIGWLLIDTIGREYA